MEFGAIVCASNQLKCLLKSHCVLGRAVQGLDAADEGGHLPFRLTGGWRQECFIALVKGASPDGFCHRQYRNLEGKTHIHKQTKTCYSAKEKCFTFQKSLQGEKSYRTVLKSLKIKAQRHQSIIFEEQLKIGKGHRLRDTDFCFCSKMKSGEWCLSRTLKTIFNTEKNLDMY